MIPKTPANKMLKLWLTDKQLERAAKLTKIAAAAAIKSSSNGNDQQAKEGQ